MVFVLLHVYIVVLDLVGRLLTWIRGLLLLEVHRPSDLAQM
jgi:hypothetical protein